jgi:SAM-dependent methyltransferase
MPSESELNTYYSKSYWVARGDQPSLLRGRDLSHFLDIEPQIPVSENRGNSAGSALNFGSGHGGISYLLRARGYRVLNVDPSSTSSPFFESASAVPVGQNEFDVVYASHSLEHVTDPVGTVEKLVSCLRKDGIFYVEVPNPMVGRNPSQLPELHPPHTIYFTPAFFEELPLRTIRLGTFDYRGDLDGVWRDDEHGEVIRFIGAR